MKKLTFLVLALFMSAAIFAQSSKEQTPQKYTDVTWQRVVLVNYKPGKVGDAKEIIKKYQSAGAKAGTPGPEQYWFVTGSYDMMIIWTLEGGPSDLEWQSTSNGIKWRKALVEQEGSEEAADKLQDKYSSLIASSTVHIVRKQN